MPITIINKDETAGKATPAQERMIAEREKKTRKCHPIYTVNKDGELLGYGSTEEDIEIKNGNPGQVGCFGIKNIRKHRERTGCLGKIYLNKGNLSRNILSEYRCTLCGKDANNL